MKLWLKSMLLLAACVSCSPSGGNPPPEPPATPTLTLDLTQAARTDRVTATTTGLSLNGAQVFIGTVAAPVQSSSGNTLVFQVPSTVKPGMQVVRVTSGTTSVTQNLDILGNVATQEVFLLVKAGVTEADFAARLKGLNPALTLLSFKPLGGVGPCGNAIARIGLPAGQSVGAVLAQLRRSDQADVVLQVDPQSIWDNDLDHLGSIGATQAHQRNRLGAGVTIAVLDTGVTKHRQLISNLLPGYDFVSEDSDPTDQFDDPQTQTPDGHGTPIAILAAGSSLGVAPAAKILPIRIADPNGQILASEAVRGVCYALKNADNKKLVLNLSFGGDTPVNSLKAVLSYALSQNVLVVAAAGNQGPGGPTHYPAAYDLPGLVAVAALKQMDNGWLAADFSTRGAYVDIAAPGAGLSSGNLAGTYAAYDGTSFAAPLVAGALALWREANPTATPAELEQKLKTTAHALPNTAPNEVGSGLLNLSTLP